MKPQSLRKSAGFTLLETLMGGAIIVLTITSSLAAGRIIQQAASRSQQNAQMSTLADSALDQVRVMRDNAPGSLATLATTKGWVKIDASTATWQPSAPEHFGVSFSDPGRGNPLSVAGILANTADLTAFNRTVTVQKLTGQGALYDAAAVALGNGASSSTLAASTYQVSVEIDDTTTGRKFFRSMLLTDWK